MTMLGTIISVKHPVEFKDLRDLIPYPVGMVYSGKHNNAQHLEQRDTY